MAELPQGRRLMSAVWRRSTDSRLSANAAAALDAATAELLAPLDRSVADALESVSRVEVPDLPDRIVAATAVALGTPLISRDRKIRASQVQTLW